MVLCKKCKEEEWKDIPGYSGYYQASSLGRIRSIDRIVKTKRKTNSGEYVYKKVPSKIISFGFDYNHGYGRFLVILQKEGKQKCHQVSTLIADTFLPKPDYKVRIGYKNNKSCDNRVDNLYWIKVQDRKLISNKHHKGVRVKDLKTGNIYKSFVEASLATNINKQMIRRSTLGQGNCKRFKRMKK